MSAVSYYANNAATTLNGSITDVATTIVLTDGSAFPSPTGGGWFWLTLEATGGVIEIVKVTNRTTHTLTVVRGQQGTTAVAWADLATAQHRWTKADADYVNAHAAAHLPGGVDALTTGTPVMVGTSGNNAEGVAASLARSDHDHMHNYGLGIAAPLVRY